MKKALLFTMAIQISGLTVAAPVPASTDEEPEWYQADLIVFRYLEDSSGEAWPAVTQHKTRSGALTLKSSQPEKKPLVSDNLPEPVDSQVKPIPVDLARDAFIRLPGSEFLLSKQSASISRSSRYEVITQMAWRMPVAASIKEQAVKVRASGDQGTGYLLDGTITVSASRYLHVDANFWFNELAPEALFSEITDQETVIDSGTVTETGQQSSNLIRLEPLFMEKEGVPLRITRNFQLKEKRRIKNSKEIQYLDTPVIGVLFKLTPYERPQTIPEISTETLEQQSLKVSSIMAVE